MRENSINQQEYEAKLEELRRENSIRQQEYDAKNEEEKRKHEEKIGKLESKISELQEGTMRGEDKGPGFFVKLGAVADHVVDKVEAAFDTFKSWFS